MDDDMHQCIQDPTDTTTCNCEPDRCAFEDAIARIKPRDRH